MIIVLQNKQKNLEIKQNLKKSKMCLFEYDKTVILIVSFSIRKKLFEYCNDMNNNCNSNCHVFLFRDGFLKD